jgi:hypothetical protein
MKLTLRIVWYKKYSRSNSSMLRNAISPPGWLKVKPALLKVIQAEVST